MRGMLRSTERPGASREAAMSLSAEFLAPEIPTDPARRAPPVTKRRSMRGIVPARPPRPAPAEPLAQGRQRDPRLGSLDLGLRVLVVVGPGRSQLLEAPVDRVDVD